VNAHAADAQTAGRLDPLATVCGRRVVEEKQVDLAQHRGTVDCAASERSGGIGGRLPAAD